ncbi:MAG: branched-chain amino acid ABC transporter permease, partial [Propionibacteriaceae bacterium]|nr:branched-chain amino acid ABC transporter permease [Propionibacteriaceae bacterium]
SSDQTARLMGIPTRTVTLFSWAIAGVLGMLAAVMIAPTTTVTPTFMNAVQVSALFACVLGGFQTFYGPVLAAYIIAVASNFLKLYVSTVWGDQIMFGLILVFLLLRPNGLIGKTYMKKV